MILSGRKRQIADGPNIIGFPPPPLWDAVRPQGDRTLALRIRLFSQPSG